MDSLPMSEENQPPETVNHNNSMDSILKTRNPRFSSDEVQVLLDEVRKNRMVVVGRKLSGVSTDTKKRAWAEITARVNETGDGERNVLEVIKKWSDLKCRTMSKVTARQSSLNRRKSLISSRVPHLNATERTVHQIVLDTKRDPGEMPSSSDPPGPMWVDDDDDEEPGEGEDEFGVMYSSTDEGVDMTLMPPPPPPMPTISGLMLPPPPHTIPSPYFPPPPHHTLPSPVLPPPPHHTPPGPPFPDFPPPPHHTLPSPDFPPPPHQTLLSPVCPPPPQHHTLPSPVCPPPPPHHTDKAMPDFINPSRETSEPPFETHYVIPAAPARDRDTEGGGDSRHDDDDIDGGEDLLPSANTKPPNLTAELQENKKKKPSSQPSLLPSSGPPRASQPPQSVQESLLHDASLSVEEQQATNVHLESVSRSLELLTESMQQLAETQREFVRDSLQLQRETMQVLRDFTGGALALINHKVNGRPSL